MTIAEHDYSAYTDDMPVGENALQRLQGLAQDQVDAEARLASLEQQVVEAKASLQRIKEHELPDLMDELEMSEFTTKAGVKIKVAEEIRGSIPANTAEQAFGWLEKHGHGRIIKRQFTIDFGKEEDKWADRFERDCAKRKKPLHLKRKKTVHPQTLKAFVKGQLGEGVDIPLATFGVHRQRFAKIKLPE